MSAQESGTQTSPPFGLRTPLVILALMWALIGSTYLVEASFYPFMIRVMVAPFLAAVATSIWWLGFTRLNWFDRILFPGVLVAALAALALPQGDKALFYVMAALPWAVTAWLGLILVTPALAWTPRKADTILAIVMAVGFFGLLRIKGLDGEFKPEYEWVFKPSAENQLLAELAGANSANPANTAAPAELKAQPGDWPAFRGPAQDSVVRDLEIATDWVKNPPKTLWKHRIGPGWSSFSVVGDRLFTQEQRGDNELVACYHADTGAELWTHAVATRFSEPVAGPGPRSTPTYVDGKLFAQGASGHVLCLDAFTGKPAWTRDLRADTGAQPPTWGFSASPLVHKGLVILYAGAQDKTAIAYKADTGDIAWISSRQTKPELSYATAHLVTLHGVEQILLLSDRGATSMDPLTGAEIWSHLWETNGVVRCIQPAIVDGTDIVIGTGLGVGSQRVHVDCTNGKWSTTEVWKTARFKPYYNDMVLRDGHAYGFDGSMLVCVDLKTGDIRWKARGYGTGQVLLLQPQGLLAVLTEKGEIALVEANPAAHRELAKLKVIEGKTWNHPVIARGRLYARNGEEVACLELPKPTPKAE